MCARRSGKILFYLFFFYFLFFFMLTTLLVQKIQNLIKRSFFFVSVYVMFSIIPSDDIIFIGLPNIDFFESFKTA